LHRARGAAELGVSAAIVVTRLQRLGWIPPKKLNLMKTFLSWAPPGTHAEVPENGGHEAD
jgi:hypothetical protein